MTTQSRRPRWLWPAPSSPTVARVIWAVAARGETLSRRGRWLISAALIGVVPLLIGYRLALWQAQVLTGLLLALALLPSVISDRFFRAAGIVAMTIGCHSAAAIALSVADPSGAALALKDSSQYWEQTWRWVRSGEDREYQSGIWLPTHFALVLAVPLTAYTSFGILPLARGVQEIDLMNYYVGQLIRGSERPELAIVLGWHPWSFLRGLAYTFLIFEATSWSIERMSGRKLTTARRRRLRIACGLALAILDAIAKRYLAPVIQHALNANLKAELPADFVP